MCVGVLDSSEQMRLESQSTAGALRHRAQYCTVCSNIVSKPLTIILQAQTLVSA